MPASDKQLQANRRNARRSTGPRTERGKKASRLNALKHGVFAHHTLVDDGEGREDQDEFQALLSQLRRDRDPQGILEEMLVEQIAVASWRLRRVLRAEVGEIRTAQDSLSSAAQDRTAADLRRTVRSLCPDPDHQHYSRHESLPSTSAGLRFLLQVLQGVILSVEEHNLLTPEAQGQLVAAFGGDPAGLAHRCRLLAPPPDPFLGPEFAEPLPPARREELLALLRSEQARLEQRLPTVQEREALALSAERAHLSLPSAAAAHNILGYERAIQSQLNRALTQLDRLQRQRQGR